MSSNVISDVSNAATRTQKFYLVLDNGSILIYDSGQSERVDGATFSSLASRKDNDIIDKLRVGTFSSLTPRLIRSFIELIKIVGVRNDRGFVGVDFNT